MKQTSENELSTERGDGVSCKLIERPLGDFYTVSSTCMASCHFRGKAEPMASENIKLGEWVFGWLGNLPPSPETIGFNLNKFNRGKEGNHDIIEAVVLNGKHRDYSNNGRIGRKEKSGGTCNGKTKSRRSSQHHASLDHV